MQIPFTAYADDLSDFLASTVEFEVDGAAFRALDDGRVVETDSASVQIDDLCVVAASGPRGRVERRLWTRQYPVRARVGPYVLLGYLHAPPTIDPLKNTDRRPILAMTSSILEYDQGGVWTRVESDAILVNSSKIDILEPADEEDLGVSRAVELTTDVDPRAKDMTGADAAI